MLVMNNECSLHVPVSVHASLKLWLLRLGRLCQTLPVKLRLRIVIIWYLSC